MTKRQLVAVVAKHAHLTKRAANDAVETVFAEITRSLGKGQKVVISGFGTFDRSTVGDKEVVPFGKQHLRTKVKGHGKAIFKPSNTLKEAVW